MKDNSSLCKLTGVSGENVNTNQEIKKVYPLIATIPIKDTIL